MDENQFAQLISGAPEVLTSVASQVLATEAAPLGRPSVERVGRSVGSGTVGIFRVAGHAQTRMGKSEWSAVVKVLGDASHPTTGFDGDPYRELEVYRSDVFADLGGGVRSARCYTIQERDDMHLLWLEDLTDAPQPPWETDQFVRTARHLGRFNAYWTERTLPDWIWLSHRGFRADFTGRDTFQRVFERLPAQLDHPLMRRFAPPTAAQALLQHWDRCDQLLIHSEGTSKGICHLDCHPRNLFPMQESGGESHTIGIDWAKVGIANLGIDLGHLLASSMTWLDITADEAVTLREPVLDGYLSGLADSGWSGNPDGVRLTYLTRVACEGIRNTNLVSLAIINPEWRATMERLSHRPIAELCDRFGENLTFFFDCGNEALQASRRL